MIYINVNLSLNNFEVDLLVLIIRHLSLRNKIEYQSKIYVIGAVNVIVYNCEQRIFKSYKIHFYLCNLSGHIWKRTFTC